VALWALVEITAISRRQGVWIKGDAPSWGAEAVTVIITATVIALIVYIHPWLSGIPVHW
jgi:hypothetical protein